LARVETFFPIDDDRVGLLNIILVVERTFGSAAPTDTDISVFVRRAEVTFGRRLGADSTTADFDYRSALKRITCDGRR